MDAPGGSESDESELDQDRISRLSSRSGITFNSRKRRAVARRALLDAQVSSNASTTGDEPPSRSSVQHQRAAPLPVDASAVPAEPPAPRANQDGEEDDEEEGTGSNAPLVLAAFCWHGNQLGGAALGTQGSTLYVMRDVPLTPGRTDDVAALIRMMVQQMAATVLLLPAKGDDDYEALLDHIESDLPHCAFEFRPPSEFGYQAACAKLSSLSLAEPDHSIDLDNTEGVRCLGALISHVRRGGAGYELDDIADTTFAVENVALKRFMELDASAWAALNIFVEDVHPSVHSSRKKEGVSLFGIMDHTRTLLGRRLLRTWFLRPEVELEIIAARHDMLDFLLRPKNDSMLQNISDHMSKIKAIPLIMERMKRGACKASDWMALYRFCFYAQRIKTVLQGAREPPSRPMIRSWIDERFHTADLAHVLAALHHVVDFEEVAMQQRFVVKIHVDNVLDEKKRVYGGLEDFLSQVASMICQDIPALAQANISVVYWPQIGYLVCVPIGQESANSAAAQFEQYNWNFQFAANSKAYFRNAKTVEMDELVGDIHGDIVGREIEISHELAGKVLEYESVLQSTAIALSELDCFISLARAAKEFNLRRPEMTESNTIIIKNGRHILQELCVSNFIPNDTIIDGESIESKRSMLLLTGANYSGKSVYLKQVGLIAYMAHVGSFVPAEEAVIGVVDRIATRMRTKESVSKAASSFLIDLRQALFAIRSCTARSLVLIDEFGKGTAVSDGIGLQVALLRELGERGDRAPKVICCTHFHEIIELDLLQGLSVAYLTMELLQTSPADGSPSITFLYKCREGTSTGSWGTECARAAGVPPPIIERAERVTGWLSKGEAIEKLHNERSLHAARAQDAVLQFLAAAPDDARDIDIAALRQLTDRFKMALLSD